VPSDASWQLYRTQSAAWFEVAADHDGVVESFIALSDRQAQIWLERNANNLVERYFGPMPELQPMAEPTSIEKRRLILAATSLLKALGHAGFDRMLLELGVPEDVGAGSGLLARSTSLGRYLLGNPDACAYDRSNLGDAIIRRAQTLFDRGQSANVSAEEWAEFDEALCAYRDVAGDMRVAETTSPKKSAAASADLSVTLEPLSSAASTASAARPKARRKVFIVHGHDVGPREAVARTLERLDFEPVILHERPNRGRTIITKFQEEATDVGFAVVLLTPDDPATTPNSSSGRARQNVVFELGFFIGILGPERVAAIMKGDVERPSDFEGVMYIEFDSGGSWRHLLARELKAAGFEVDMNRIV
jgi:predicted nucleotide-binding protein